MSFIDCLLAKKIVLLNQTKLLLYQKTHLKSFEVTLSDGNLKILIFDEADEVIEELFELLLLKYQTGLAELMKLSDFIFDCVNLKRFGSYIN